MIPLSVPNLSGNELKYIQDCIETNWVSSVGSYVDRFEQSLAEFTGARFAVSVVNGSAALHISMLLAGVEQDDHVIIPNITFVASANTITYLKANPILVDIDPATWQMDLNLLQKFLSENTEVRKGNCVVKKTGKRIRCIMPVHVLGNMCDMDRLMSIAAKFNLKVVEDATESLGSYYNGRHSGRFGLFGCVSFNGNKIITTGGGGMILTDDEFLAKKAKHITTQAKSDPFEYYHDDIGYNYRLVNVLAAMGLAQMEQLPGFLKTKKRVCEKYVSAFSGLPGFSEQQTGKNVSPNNWLQTFTFSDSAELMKHLIANKIQVRPFWVPMNKLPMFRDALYVNESDISGAVYNKCVSLPCSTNITDREQDQVIASVNAFYAAKK
jgi:perosamine synthetase